MVSYRGRIRANPSAKLAITVDPEIRKNIIEAAAHEGVSVSAWMTVAAREALHRRTGLAAIALWERQHGRFTAEEMEESVSVCGRSSVRHERLCLRRRRSCGGGSK
jgi:uncharacterized protein (DUF1778 family)